MEFRAALNLTYITDGAVYHVRYTAAMHYVESMACHAPYVVHGAPGPARTDDLRIRSPTLYPTELRALWGE